MPKRVDLSRPRDRRPRGPAKDPTKIPDRPSREKAFGPIPARPGKRLRTRRPSRAKPSRRATARSNPIPRATRVIDRGTATKAAANRLPGLAKERPARPPMPRTAARTPTNRAKARPAARVATRPKRTNRRAIRPKRIATTPTAGRRRIPAETIRAKAIRPATIRPMSRARRPTRPIQTPKRPVKPTRAKGLPAEAIRAAAAIRARHPKVRPSRHPPHRATIRTSSMPENRPSWPWNTSRIRWSRRIPTY